MLVPKELIVVSESTNSSSEEGTRFAPLDVPSIRAMGAITVKGIAAKRARTSELLGTTPSPPIDKEEKVVENLSFTSDNELLNAAEITAKLMPPSMAEMLCGRMFEGSQMLLTPAF